MMAVRLGRQQRQLLKAIAERVAFSLSSLDAQDLVIVDSLVRRGLVQVGPGPQCAVTGDGKVTLIVLHERGLL